MYPDHLYIIGNGFDRYHGAKSSYWDFRGYLLRHNDWVVRFFELFFGPRSLANNFERPEDLECSLAFGRSVPYPKNTWATTFLWSDFERYLSELDREKIFDFLDSRLPHTDLSDEDFSYADYLAPIDFINDTVRMCSFEMQYHFHRWINTLQYRKGFKRDMIRLDPNALFLNFNYTLFLEEHYLIPRRNICYIHGDRREPFGSLVLGHREIDAEASFERWHHKHEKRKRYRKNLKDRRGRYFANDKLVYLAYFLDREKESIGHCRGAARYYAIEEAVRNTEEYFRHNIKQCDEIIRRHQPFFDSLKEIKSVTILGHSLSDVDLPYFQEIVRHIRNPENVQWQFTCHSMGDLSNIERYRKILDIRSENNARPLYKISDFKRDRAGIHSHR